MTLHHKVRRAVRLKELSVQLQFLHATAQIRFILLAFRKLFNCDKVPSFEILTEPNDGAAALTKDFKFLKSIRTPIIRAIHLDIFVRQVLHDRPLQIELVFRQYNIIVCIVIDILIDIFIFLAIVNLLWSWLLAGTACCIVTLPLQVLPRNDIVIVVVFAHLLTLPLLLVLLGRVVVRVLSCRDGLAAEARIRRHLSFESIHMQAVIHITLVLLPRLTA